MKTNKNILLFSILFLLISQNESISGNKKVYISDDVILSEFNQLSCQVKEVKSKIKEIEDEILTLPLTSSRIFDLKKDISDYNRRIITLEDRIQNLESQYDVKIINGKYQIKQLDFFCTIGEYFNRNNQGTDKYSEIYPYGDHPSIYLTPGSWFNESNKPTNNTNYDNALRFSATPIVRYSFFNNFHKGLERGEVWTYSLGAHFNPQIRMYEENSSPVLMPSFRVTLNQMFMYHFKPKDLIYYQQSDSIYYTKCSLKERTHCFFGGNIDIGHFSNGQRGGTFDETLIDESNEDTVAYNNNYSKKEFYNRPIDSLINRKTGNFEIPWFYRGDLFFKILRTNEATQKWTRMLTFGAGYSIYDIDEGKNGNIGDEIFMPSGRLHSSVEWFEVYTIPLLSSTILKVNYDKLIFDKNEVLFNVPFEHRITLRFTLNTHAFKNENIGLFFEGVHGFDDYNLRFVDKTNFNLNIGLSWAIMPPTMVHYNPELLD